MIESPATVSAENGPIDVLVNNAGIERFGAIEEVDISDLRAVMETNYFDSVRCVGLQAGQAAD